MSATTKTIVLIGKCKVCKTLTRIECETFESGFPTRGHYRVECAHCFDEGHIRYTDSREAKLSAIKCGAKCTNATGPACSCECGGRNHGAHF